MKLNLKLGEKVYCQNEQCGRLLHLVIDPERKRVMDLIVEKGFWMSKVNYVLPLHAVTNASGDEITLCLCSDELDAYIEYRDVASREMAAQRRVPDGGAHMASHGQLHVGGSAAMVDVSDPKLRQGPRAGYTVLGSETPVENYHTTIGYLDHVLLDNITGEITGVVVRRGFLTESLVLPKNVIEEISAEGIFVLLSAEELNTLSRYASQPDEEILHKLHERLYKLDLPVFSHVDAHVENGVVYLRGEVRSVAIKHHATETAQTIVGVLDVQNDLVIDVNLDIYNNGCGAEYRTMDKPVSHRRSTWQHMNIA